MRLPYATDALQFTQLEMVAIQSPGTEVPADIVFQPKQNGNMQLGQEAQLLFIHAKFRERMT